jgi:hypothetical protein
LRKALLSFASVAIQDKFELLAKHGEWLAPISFLLARCRRELILSNGDPSNSPVRCFRGDLGAFSNMVICLIQSPVRQVDCRRNNCRSYGRRKENRTRRNVKMFSFLFILGRYAYVHTKSTSLPSSNLDVCVVRLFSRRSGKTPV